MSDSSKAKKKRRQQRRHLLSTFDAVIFGARDKHSWGYPFAFDKSGKLMDTYEVEAMRIILRHAAYGNTGNIPQSEWPSEVPAADFIYGINLGMSQAMQYRLWLQRDYYRFSDVQFPNTV